MKDNFIDYFLEVFFKENNCQLLKKEEAIYEVQLTKEMDKAIMNRPFYWHYMESINEQGKPMKLTIITDKEKRENKGEWITSSSPRFQQFQRHLKEQAQYTKLFQVIQTKVSTMLHPWLVINFCITYKGNQVKEEIISIGLNLINGFMAINMMGQLKEIPLGTNISNRCFTISPIIKLNSGFRRMMTYIEEHIIKQDLSWAVGSQDQLEKEQAMIRYFYPEADSDERNMELEAAHQRFAPMISYYAINGGLFYLKPSLNCIKEQ